MKDRAVESIGQAVLTNSKKSFLGIVPTHFKLGSKAHLWDMSDTRWLDYVCGLGTNLFGYGNDQINMQIQRYLYNGSSHSMPTFHEVMAAESIKELIPFIDKVKFLKTGSEACSAAIRMARAYTGRDLVLSSHYHGWSDDFVSLTEPATGVPKRDFIRRLDVSEISSEVAAVIIEPVETDDSESNVEWLKSIRRSCDEHNVVLIYDEVITGLRYKNYAVANNYGVTPDLIILGKALGNGWPIAAVGGSKDILDGNYFVSSTYAGEILSLTALRECIRLIMHDYRYDLDHLIRSAKEFVDQFNENDSSIRIQGYGTRGRFVGDENQIWLYFQEMAKANILFCKSFFYNWDLIKYQDEVIFLSREILRRIANGDVTLEWDIPANPFAQEVRNGKG